MIAKTNNFIVTVDTSAISDFIDNLLAERADLVEDYHNGKQNVFGFFMGQATRALTGKATPKAIKEYLEQALNK